MRWCEVTGPKKHQQHTSTVYTLLRLRQKTKDEGGQAAFVCGEGTQGSGGNVCEEERRERQREKEKCGTWGVKNSDGVLMQKDDVKVMEEQNRRGTK